MVILRTRNKITDFFMILAWASPFKQNTRVCRKVFQRFKGWAEAGAAKLGT